MNTTSKFLQIGSWAFGIVIIIVGVLNIFLVHVVPGAIYLILSLIYIPPANDAFQRKTGFPIPVIIKIILGVVMFFFTLGVSDLGDMID